MYSTARCCCAADENIWRCRSDTELSYPSTLTGAETSVKYFAGDTADNGMPYSSIFFDDQANHVLIL